MLNMSVFLTITPEHIFIDLDREEGRRRETDIIDQPAPVVSAPTGDWTRDPLVHGTKLQPILSHTSQG